MQVLRQMFGMNCHSHEHEQERQSIGLQAEMQEESPSSLQGPCEVRPSPVKVKLQELRLKQTPLECKSVLITVRAFTKNDDDVEIVQKKRLQIQLKPKVFLSRTSRKSVFCSRFWFCHLHTDTFIKEQSFFLLCFRSYQVEGALFSVIFTAVVTRPQGGKSWEQAREMPLWVSPDGSALLSPGSGALVLGDQTWANAGCKACSTPPKVDENSQEQTAKQPGNFWTLQAMISLKPFPSCPNKSPVGPGDFMKSQRRLTGRPCGSRKGMGPWLHQIW